MKNKFNFHSLKIINEIEKSLIEVDNTGLEELVQQILLGQRIFIAGLGRTGLIMRCFAMRLMHLGFNVNIVGDVTSPSLNEKDLLLIGSGSGETSSLVSISSIAKKIGAKIILFTINRSSSIGQLASLKLCIPGVSPKLKNNTKHKSVQPMGSLFEQSLFLTLETLILILMEKKKINSELMYNNHSNLE